MTEKEFDATRDAGLIAAGTHFWCKACVVARPMAEKSPDERYCRRCYDLLKYETSLILESGSRGRRPWMPRDTPAPNLSPISAPQQGAETVIKLIPKELSGVGCDKTTGNGIKHAGGRPKKTSDYSKRTEWRRRKEAVTA